MSQPPPRHVPLRAIAYCWWRTSATSENWCATASSRRVSSSMKPPTPTPPWNASAAARPPTAAMPILMLTAKGAEVDRVLGLEMGADDYVVKPFSPREVLARIRALLRRARLISEPGEGGGFERGRLKMDFGTYEAFIDGARLEMTLREFELLRFFVQHPLRVYTREQLLDLVWGRDTFVEPRTVDVHVRRLRQHIEKDDANPELILTVRSVRYSFHT